MVGSDAIADDLQALLTSQEAVLADTLDGPDGLFMILQVQHRLEIPPYDRGSVMFRFSLSPLDRGASHGPTCPSFRKRSIQNHSSPRHRRCACDR